MAVCPYCDQEMTNKVGCTQLTYADFPDKLVRQRIPFYGDWDDTCHDCGTPAGRLHHPGCDAEQCPLCQGQAISCGCPHGEEDLND